MKILTLMLIFILSGCIGHADVKKHGDWADHGFTGEIKGNYSALARCVSDTMEADKRWSINSLVYNVRVYPDIERSEVNAHGSSMWGATYAFNLELNKVSPNVSNAVLTGLKFESREALKTLQGCANK